VNDTQAKRPWLEVVVSGITTTVKPAPTDFPKSSNKSKAVALAEKYNMSGLADWNISTPRVTKRWWTVPLDQETRPEDVRVWPPCADGTRTVTFCFENVDTYHTVIGILALALAKWAPAMRLSLTFRC